MTILKLCTHWQVHRDAGLLVHSIKLIPCFFEMLLARFWR